MINSIGFDEIVRIKHSVWYRIMPSILAEYPGYESVAEDWAFLGREWDERNSIMADNIMKASGEYPGRRLVAVVGCEHRYILRDLLLERDGVLLKEFWEILALSKGEFEVSYMEIVRLVREIKRIQVQSKSTEDAWEKAQGHVRRLEDLGVRIDRDWFRHIRHML